MMLALESDARLARLRPRDRSLLATEGRRFLDGPPTLRRENRRGQLTLGVRDDGPAPDAIAEPEPARIPRLATRHVVAIRDGLNALPYRHRGVLEPLYGFRTVLVTTVKGEALIGPPKLAEVARRLGIDLEEARRLRDEAIALLRGMPGIAGVVDDIESRMASEDAARPPSRDGNPGDGLGLLLGLSAVWTSAYLDFDPTKHHVCPACLNRPLAEGTDCLICSRSARQPVPCPMGRMLPDPCPPRVAVPDTIVDDCRDKVSIRQEKALASLRGVPDPDRYVRNKVKRARHDGFLCESNVEWRPSTRPTYDDDSRAPRGKASSGWKAWDGMARRERPTEFLGAPDREYSHAEKVRLVALAAVGMAPQCSARMVASVLGLSNKTVSSWVKSYQRYGTPPRKPQRRVALAACGEIEPCPP